MCVCVCGKSRIQLCVTFDKIREVTGQQRFHCKVPQKVPAGIQYGFFTASSCSERGARRGGSDGQREAEESAQAPDHLLQLPAGSAAEEIPVGAVPGPAGASRAGSTAGPHADTGQRTTSCAAIQCGKNDRRLTILKKSVGVLSLTLKMLGEICI